MMVIFGNHTYFAGMGMLNTNLPYICKSLSDLNGDLLMSLNFNVAKIARNFNSPAPSFSNQVHEQ